MVLQFSEGLRIDKWLWAVRLYKTRALAAEACRRGQVQVAGASVKPARCVHVGDLILTLHGDVRRTTKVLGIIARRVGAPAAKVFAEDLTPPSEFAKGRESDFNPIPLRPKGSGRPTKKERRAMEKFL